MAQGLCGQRDRLRVCIVPLSAPPFRRSPRANRGAMLSRYHMSLPVGMCTHVNRCSCQIYDANCHLKGTIEREDGFFMCTDHIPEVGSNASRRGQPLLSISAHLGVPQMNQIVACSSDLQVSFYDDSTYRLQKCFHCPSSQVWSNNPAERVVLVA